MFVEEKRHGEITEAPAKVLDEVAQRLMIASNLIVERGHAKGAYSYASGELCMLGAVRVARDMAGQPKDGDSTPEVSRIESALGSRCVHRWNDMPERTAAEVVAKLREVALS